jgi:hypothetical protein
MSVVFSSIEGCATPYVFKITLHLDQVSPVILVALGLLRG